MADSEIIVNTEILEEQENDLLELSDEIIDSKITVDLGYSSGEFIDVITELANETNKLSLKIRGTCLGLKKKIHQTRSGFISADEAAMKKFDNMATMTLPKYLDSIK